MAKRSTRLQFTKEELEVSEVKQAASTAQKAVEKLEKAEERLPTRTVRKKQRTVDPQTGKVITRLRFEEAEKKPPSTKLSDTVKRVPVNQVHNAAHRQAGKSGEDNIGVDAANAVSMTAESGIRSARSLSRRHKARPYRKTSRLEGKADQANVKALEQTFQQQTGFSSNPYSRWQQKRAIKQQYAEAKAGRSGTVEAAQVTARAAERATKKTKKTGSFVDRHKRGFAVLGVAAILAGILAAVLSSCSVLMQSGISTVAISTYPSEDADMLSAEAQYCGMEADLQARINDYESTHDYDEYQYDLDDIGHDPYVLISILTAYFGRAWTVDEAGSLLSTLFDAQYTLTESVSEETRTRTVPGADGEETEETYTYTICHVTLENFDLSHIPVYLLSEEQLSLYSVYMATLGNRSDLFPGSNYVNLYGGSYGTYEIPPEALEDEQFAAMITEAEKYLGYPYVWGGSSPSTSFDCSGFVSWVINNCGVGWSVGRMDATGLYNICTHVSSANARSGDLIFFQGTYNTAGMSHVGIYVGNGMMIHCGDPIQYTSIESSYWQTHFAAFGRLPNP